MQKLASEFEKTNIISHREQAILGRLFDIIINPNDGNVIGITFVLGDKKGTKMVANVFDISGAGANFIMINSTDSMSPPSEIIRIKEILDSDIKISGSVVIDEEGKKLGKVRDYSVNLKTMRIGRLYVTPAKMIRFFSQDLIISDKNILKIEKNKITVKSGKVKERRRVSNIVKASKPTRANVAHRVGNSKQ